MQEPALSLLGSLNVFGLRRLRTVAAIRVLGMV